VRRLLASALAVLVVFGATASNGRTTAHTRGYWIVLGSDRDGTTRAYSVRSDGSRLSPILARGTSAVPLAMSRDRGTIAYIGARGLYVSRPDGSRFRLVARSVSVSSSAEPILALSPDGGLVAFARPNASGIWIVRTDGRGLRRIALTGVSPDWSPDGKALALSTSGSVVIQPLARGRRIVARGTYLARPTWSPNGRWIAYVSFAERSGQKGLWVVRPDGKQRHRVARDAASAFAWSPDSRSLAYGREGGAAVVGVGGGGRRALRLGLAASVAAWSPDGRRLVLSGHTGDEPDQIWIVRRDGRGLRRLTSAGRNFVIGWTRLAPKLPQARPVPPTERVAGASTVATRAFLTELSADGTRVAFVPSDTRSDCDHVSVWTPARRSLVRVSARFSAPCANVGTLTYGILDLELAGTRVAWADIAGCGNSCDVGLKTATLGTPVARAVDDAGGGGGAGGGDFHDFHLRGHGNLLVYNGGYPGTQVLRIGSGRATTLRRGAHSAFVESVSGSRVAIRELDAVTVLDEQGNVVRVVPFARREVRAARLDGARLVVSRGDVIEVYDVATGAVERQRPLPSGFELTDADGGIAVLQRGGEILILRLADGRSFTLAPGRKPVLADLEAPGLYYSYTTAGRGGRLVFLPRSEVVQKLGG
jgi:hypothetical protein